MSSLFIFFLISAVKWSRFPTSFDETLMFMCYKQYSRFPSELNWSANFLKGLSSLTSASHPPPPPPSFNVVFTFCFNAAQDCAIVCKVYNKTLFLFVTGFPPSTGEKLGFLSCSRVKLLFFTFSF